MCLAITLLLAGSSFGCSSGKSGIKPKVEMRDFVQRYAAAWNSKDPNAPAAFYSEGGSLKVNDHKPAVGRAAITKVASGFMTAFPDLVLTVDKIVEKPGLTEFHWTLTGTNTGRRGTGNRVRISGYEEWRIGTDGLIAESKGYFDETEYDRQIEHGVKE